MKKILIQILILLLCLFAQICITKAAETNDSLTELGEVKNIKAQALSTDSIKLSWSKQAKAAGYRIYCKQFGEWKKIADVQTTKYVQKKLKIGTKYSYTVCSYQLINGKKVLTQIYNQVGVSIVTVPAQPKNITTTSGKGNITIKWSAVKGADYYYLYRQNAGSSKWTVLKKIKGKETVSYADTSVKKGKSYVYTVAAASNSGKNKSTYSKRGIYCVYSSEKAYRYAQNIVNSITTVSMSKIQRLRACYDWYWKKKSGYKRDYENPLKLKGTSWIPRYANYLFENNKGNCYRHACSFAYMAKVLGYDAKVVVGEVPSVSGGWTGHGWVEITINKVKYVFDERLQFSWKAKGRNYNMFKVTYKQYPFRLRAKKRFSIPS